MQTLTDIDRSILAFFNGSDSLFVDNLAVILTSGLTWIPLYLSLLYVVIKNNETMKQIMLVIGCMILSIVLSDGVADFIVKPMVERLRPSNDPLIKYTVNVVEGIRGNSFSFFSAHASNTFCIAMFFSLLVRNKVFTINSDVPASFILPKKPAMLLKNVLQKDGSEVTIRFDERNAEINYSDGVITCRLIEGRYPNYNSVIPQNNPNRLTVDRNAMLSALRRVQPFANSTNLIKFHMENGSLQLDAEDYDFSKTATERMSCDYNGQPMSIGFNGSSFIEILSNFDCQEVIIQLADPSRAGVVVPAEQPADQNVLMLLMPMFINE